MKFQRASDISHFQQAFMFHQILKSRESETDRWKQALRNTYYTPDDKRQLELMRETEDRQPQERKHTRFCGIQQKREE